MFLSKPRGSGRPGPKEAINIGKKFPIFLRFSRGLGLATGSTSTSTRRRPWVFTPGFSRAVFPSGQDAEGFRRAVPVVKIYRRFAFLSSSKSRGLGAGSHHPEVPSFMGEGVGGLLGFKSSRGKRKINNLPGWGLPGALVRSFHPGRCYGAPASRSGCTKLFSQDQPFFLFSLAWII